MLHGVFLARCHPCAGVEVEGIHYGARRELDIQTIGGIPFPPCRAARPAIVANVAIRLTAVYRIGPSSRYVKEKSESGRIRLLDTDADFDSVLNNRN